MDNYSFDCVPMSAPALTLYGPADLVAAVPHLLGFVPTSSLVIVFIEDCGQRVVLTVRADLPAAAPTHDYLQSWQRQLQAIAENNEASRVVLCAFTTDADSGPSAAQTSAAASAMTAIALECEQLGMFVYDQLLCFTDRWRSMLCSDRSCCPADGTPIDPARGDRIAAEFVAEGVSVRSGRDALATACAPLPDSDPAAVLFRAALASQAASSGADWATAVAPQERQQRAEQCVQTLVGGGDADASVALALADIRVRDAVIRMLTHDEGADERRRAEANLIATMRVSPRDLRAPIATVAAGLAWQRGDGAIGADCLEVALDADPDYSLARLLRRALCNAVPPNVWVTAVGQTTVDECLTGSNGRQ